MKSPVQKPGCKALIFDMDGLMIDSERLYFEAQRDIAAAYDRSVDERTLWRMMGRKPLESLQIFIHDLGLSISAEELLEIRNSIMRVKLTEDLRPLPGLTEIVQTFHGVLRLAVCTGAQGEFLDLVVDRLGMREKFTVLQSSDGIERGKPHPEIYLKTCVRLGLPPAWCVVLEDSENGVRAATAAGCRAIAVPSRHTASQDFSAAHWIAMDLFEARNIIRDILNPGA